LTGCRLSLTEFQVLVRRCFLLNTRAAELIPGAMLSLDIAHAAVEVWFWRCRNPDKVGQPARSFASLSCHPGIWSNFMSPPTWQLFAVSSTSQPNLIPTKATSHHQRAYGVGRVVGWRLGRQCQPDSVNDRLSSVIDRISSACASVFLAQYSRR
jgi:hypothetical protein